MSAFADPRIAATASSAVYSAAGRVTQMVSQDGTSTYGYDAKSQLTSGTHTFQTDETYTYDNNGNRTMSGYQTGDDNRLTSDGTYNYTYDDEGNRTLRTSISTGEVTEYVWDYRNRLVKVTDKNAQGTTTQVVEYAYDVFNRRIAKSVDTSSPFDMTDAVIERYVYDDIHNSMASLDGGNVVLDFVDPDGSGTQPMALAKRYLHGEAVDQILAQEDVTKTLSDTSRTTLAAGRQPRQRPRPGQAGRHDRRALYLRHVRYRHQRRHVADPLPVHQPRTRHGHGSSIQPRPLV